MNKVVVSRLVAGFLLMAATSAANANLIRNASFEDVPSSATGQDMMPSEWVASNVSPDTYSNDGSYGLSPTGYGNFNGVTAYDGIRWVAGWSSAGQERFGQTLTDNLVLGTEYDFSSYLHQAYRPDLNHSGGYEVYLTSAYNDSPTSGEYLGYLGETTNFAEGWQQYSFSFTATAEMASLDFLMFAPTKFGAGEAYPGLDLVSLEAASSGGGGIAVPEPTSVALMGLGLLGLSFARRKKTA